MITKTQVLAKLDKLKAYSIAQDELTGPLFSPVYSAVDSYFGGSSAGLAQALTEVVQYMYNDLTRRSTIHEFEYEMKLPTNYPVGYNNVVDCFYNFASLLAMSNATLFAAFVYGVPEGAGDSEGGGGTEVPISNSYLTTWATEITAAVNTDLQAVQTLADWCKNSGGNSDLICLLENQGRIVSQLKQKEKARTIYLDRKVLEVITARNLSVYIPTYLRS
jgi:hypothetical protein